MAVLVTDELLEHELLEKRRASGGDRFDEVWEGLYVMAPMADNQHVILQGKLTTIFSAVVGGDVAAAVSPGANISDRVAGWEHNYRCPDVVVFLPGNPARDCDTHWVGGPDLAVEIVSRGDRSREKLAFYASVGVRELLILDRKPWTLELYQLRDRELKLAQRLDEGSDGAVALQTLPVSLRWVPAQPRPGIEATDRRSNQRWTL